MIRRFGDKTAAYLRLRAAEDRELLLASFETWCLDQQARARATARRGWRRWYTAKTGEDDPHGRVWVTRRGSTTVASGPVKPRYQAQD